MQLRRAREEVEASGTLVLVGQATPRHAAHFRRRLELPYPVLADADRASYRAIGARSASLGELLGPKVVARGALATLRSGVVQGRVVGDPAQLGGALVVAPGGEVTWAHLSEDASDNARAEEIVAALRAATERER